MRNFINIITESTEPTTSDENWGSETLPLTFKRTVDPQSYKSSGRAGMKLVTMVRASLFIGKLLIGGYETVEGSKKVTVFYGNGYRENVSSEEEAKLFLLRLLK